MKSIVLLFVGVFLGLATFFVIDPPIVLGIW
jgi:hypothetical protein